ncbi:T6SS immunity protein Tdi1 domain-containing protein [uncultured Clostridium sp.]|uniref:T6SS immunity protein Tdi1 domain-containing protein n=1 Tax=uncultured Clostridium sp. TaxID=59620 RepID=UPI0028ECC900|nr:T6SS immunity protein Tdi1 domain-containing protein [uncultured Clostridium sp.]
MGLFDKFKKKNMDKKSVTNNTFSQFTSVFEPSDDLVKPTEEELKQFEDILPSELLHFWKEYGFGNYGNGIIKVINPLDYMESLYEWLGKEDFSKLPILVTGFGDIFYYRKLSEVDEDICLLNIHYRNIIVCSYSLDDFLKSYIVDEVNYSKILRKELFDQVYAVKGNLKANDIYFFVPSLILGGKEPVELIDKGNANVHQSLLFQLGK